MFIGMEDLMFSYNIGDGFIEKVGLKTIYSEISLCGRFEKVLQWPIEGRFYCI
jgi:hypothetical protein